MKMSPRRNGNGSVAAISSIRDSHKSLERRVGKTETVAAVSEERFKHIGESLVAIHGKIDDLAERLK